MTARFLWSTKTRATMYSRRQYKVSIPSRKKTLSYGVPMFYRLPFLRRLYAHNFYASFFRLILPKSINERRAEVIDGLKRNWREEKRLIDKKSRNNRRTEAERATRRVETIDELKRNGRLEQQKQSTD